MEEDLKSPKVLLNKVKFIDRINAWHSREEQLIVEEFTRTTNSIHYYDSILVIQKAKRKQPYNELEVKWFYLMVLFEKLIKMKNKGFGQNIRKEVL